MTAFQNLHYSPTAISSAAKCIVTIPNHGLVAGNALRATKFVVYPTADATGMEQLNNRLFYVQQPTTNTFILSDLNTLPIDSTNFTPYIQGGQFTLTGPDLFIENGDN